MSWRFGWVAEKAAAIELDFGFSKKSNTRLERVFGDALGYCFRSKLSPFARWVNPYDFIDSIVPSSSRPAQSVAFFQTCETCVSSSQLFSSMEVRAAQSRRAARMSQWFSGTAIRKFNVRYERLHGDFKAQLCRTLLLFIYFQQACSATPDKIICDFGLRLRLCSSCWDVKYVLHLLTFGRTFTDFFDPQSVVHGTSFCPLVGATDTAFTLVPARGRWSLWDYPYTLFTFPFRLEKTE